MPAPPSTCVLWTGAVKRDGYGKACVEGRRSGAHRVSYEASVGPIPNWMQVCHRCDVPACVNPDHLFLGTFADNMADKIAKGRQNPCVGERSGKAKLSNADVAEIRRRLVGCARGTQSALAREYGVNKTTINVIANGKARRHQ